MPLQYGFSQSQNQQSITALIGRILFLLFVFFTLITTFCVTKSQASTIAEEFTADNSIETGSLVSLKQNNPQEVELSTLANSKYLIGVVIQSDDSSVTYSKTSSKLAVALSGEVKAYVTDANGDIAKGDFVGVSWLDGVGMKADSQLEQKLLGVALEDFNSDGAQEYGQIDTPDGYKNVAIGSLTIRLLDKDDRSQASATTTSTKSDLEKFLSKIAGKNVSLVKIIACLVIFVISVLVSGFFVSSSIKGSFISIGRNPLASASIYRSLLRVTTISVVIILIGAVVSYAVLAS